MTYKFRAWDKKEKRYQHCLWINSNGTIRVSPTGDPEKYHCLEDNKYSDRYIVEQYIGIDDIKGTPIYEGDKCDSYYGGTFEVKHRIIISKESSGMDGMTNYLFSGFKNRFDNYITLYYLSHNTEPFHLH